MKNLTATERRLPRTTPMPGNPALVRQEHLPGFVRAVDLPATEHLQARTSLVMQRHLLTKIEMDITREEAIVLCRTLAEHFDLQFAELNPPREDDCL